MSAPKRAWIKIDRYAIFDLARQYMLTPNDMVLLLALTNLADFRTGIWTGQLSDLTDYVRVGRDTIRKSRDRLIEQGRITEVSPFGGGTGHAGSFLILCYPALVTDCRDEVAERIALFHLEEKFQSDDDSATFVRPYDDVCATSSSKSQGKPIPARERGREGERECSSSSSSELRTEAICQICHQPVQGHPFTDHEPTVRTLGGGLLAMTPDGPRRVKDNIGAVAASPF